MQHSMRIRRIRSDEEKRRKGKMRDGSPDLAPPPPLSLLPQSSGPLPHIQVPSPHLTNPLDASKSHHRALPFFHSNHHHWDPTVGARIESQTQGIVTHETKHTSSRRDNYPISLPKEKGRWRYMVPLQGVRIRTGRG